MGAEFPCSLQLSLVSRAKHCVPISQSIKSYSPDNSDMSVASVTSYVEFISGS